MSSFSRRRFLEDSMFAAAAAVVANAAPVAFAQPAGTKSPNDRLSVCVVGCNGRGGSHIGAYTASDKNRDTEITYICDVDEAVGQKQCDAIEKKQGRRPKWVADMREAFADKNLDIVTTATPNHWHSLVAIWAMQAGKDVYVEKPVSHNVSEGRRAVEAARKYAKICQTGTQCRSAKGTIDAIEFIKNGGIGKVSIARGLCYKPRGSIGDKVEGTVPSTVDYNLWAGPARMLPVTRKKFHYDWHWIWEYGNGDLGNQGIHQMDVARWGLGVNELSKGIFSYGGRLSYIDAGETANTQTVVHDYGDKQLIFEVRGLKTDAYRGAKVGNVFHGSEGYVVLTSYNGGAAFDLKGNKIKEFTGGDNHFQNFIAAVRSRKHTDLNADILEGHLSSALCHTGNISYRLGEQITIGEAKDRLKGEDNKETYARFAEHLKENGVDEKTKISFGKTLTMDPATETFIGDADANRQLTREYRAPFIVPAAGQV
ncbi:MAG: Gfo/Idh/MocA family oxidoreductase [Planctomycetaceae bacterium]|nr:Gfo/Idh/MocA family oxidoreductase [Planctomycetaceae bacterium]